jgi:hypothetical protein
MILFGRRHGSHLTLRSTKIEEGGNWRGVETLHFNGGGTESFPALTVPK